MNRRLLQKFSKAELKRYKKVFSSIIELLDELEHEEYQKLLNGGEDNRPLLRAIHKIKTSLTIGEIK